MAKKRQKPIYFSFFQKWGILIGIFLLAAIFRLYHLATTPIGFHVDELDVGYMGRYLLLHGKDIFGYRLPLFFNKFGDFRPIGIFYLSGLSTFLFGINEFAVRFPSAIIGALTVVPMYLWGVIVSGRKRVGLVAAFILAIAPWHIVISRATSESIIGLFLVMWGLWFLYEAIIQKRARFIVYAALCLFASYFFYHTFRALVPVFVFPFMFLKMDRHMKKYVRLLVAGFFVLTIGLSFTSFGSGRLGQVAFHANPDLPKRMTAFLAGDGSVSILETRVFHNKISQYAREFVNQYISYYSMPFLFFSGGYPDRYRVPEQGLFYLSFLPLLFIGLLTFIIDPDRRNIRWYILYIFLMATLPAAITYEDSPNVQRSLPLLVPVILVMAYGLDAAWKYLVKYRLAFIGIALAFSVILIYEASGFAHQYGVHADQYKSLYRNDGNRELFARIKEHYDAIDYVVMPIAGEFPAYAAFYFNMFTSFPSSVYTGAKSEVRIGKFIFVPDICPGTSMEKRPEGRGIVIDFSECKGATVGLVEELGVVRSDHTSAYRYYTTE